MKSPWVERLAIVAVIACCLLSVPSIVEAGKDVLPRLPGQALLVDHFPEDLAVTIGQNTLQIPGGGEWAVIPSLSADGRIVASARGVPNLPLEAEPRFIVGTYSIPGNRWTDFPDLEIKGGSVAISPDGSRLACSHMSNGATRIHILDLKTGRITLGPETTRGSFLTWSPDGRRLAFNKMFAGGSDVAPSSILPEIDVLDIADGTVTKLADGLAPSWSPSGEWIAFSDYSSFLHGKYADARFRVSLIHPDGTGSKVVAVLKSGEDLFLPVIWSPDSKEFLMQRPQEDEVNPKVNISILNLANLNLTTRFRRTPEIHGWVPAN